MSAWRAISGVVLGTFVIIVVYLALSPVYEAIVPVVADDSAVQEAGYDHLPGWLMEAGLHYYVVAFLVGLVVLGVIHVLREELFVQRFR